MMTIIINTVLCVCALAGFITGAVRFFKKKKALYSQMVTAALGCAALGRLYNIAVMVCGSGIPRTFNTGVLAAVGCFMFIFSANYGEMDSLCDMNFKRNKRLRLFAFAVPAVFAAAAAAVYLKSGAPLVLRMTYAAEILFIAAAAYFNFKHLCAEDIERGIIKSLRGYNFFALLLAILYTAEIVLDAFEFIMLKSVVYLLMSACMLMIIPALDNGMTKWKVRPAKSRRNAKNG